MNWFLIIKELHDGVVVNEDYFDAMALPEALLQAEFELLRLNPMTNFDEHGLKCLYDEVTGKPQAYYAATPNIEIVINNEKRQKRLLAKLRAGLNNMYLIESDELKN